MRFGDPANVLMRWVRGSTQYRHSSLVLSFEVTQPSREAARQVGHFAPLLLRDRKCRLTTLDNTVLLFTYDLRVMMRIEL